MLLMSQTAEGLNMARDSLIFLLQQLGFIINLKKSVLLATQKLEFLELEIDSVNMTLTLSMEKVKSFTQKCRNLKKNFQPTLWEITSIDRLTLLNSISCDASIFINKISATTASEIYKKTISLPLNSSPEPKFNSGTSMVGKQPRNIKWEVNFVAYKQNYNPRRCFSEGLGDILSENINRRSMGSSKVKVTYQSARTQSYKSGPINFSQDVLSESRPLSAGQHEGPVIFDENGRD